MKLVELPMNTWKFLDWAIDEIMCESPLVIENGKVQWDRCAKATMDEVEGLQEKGLKLETVEAEETNFGFGFRAKSSDGTE